MADTRSCEVVATLVTLAAFVKAKCFVQCVKQLHGGHAKMLSYLSVSRR